MAYRVLAANVVGGIGVFKSNREGHSLRFKHPLQEGYVELVAIILVFISIGLVWKCR